MLYLLGGAARSGKSTIARRFLAQTGTPFFALDYLMMGCTGVPQLGINPDESDLITAAKLSPLISAMTTAMIENGEEYLLEGVQLQPALAAALSQRFPGQVRAAFVGYAAIDVATKVQQIRQFAGGNNDWLSDQDAAQLIDMVAALKGVSQTLCRECQDYGLPYFDTSNDFTAALDDVLKFFVQG